MDDDDNHDRDDYDYEDGQEDEEEDYDYGEQENLGEEMLSSSRRDSPRSGRYEANNRGGYGNPPIKSQFKAGGKGGPGRKKGESNLESAMRKAIGKKLDVNKDGQSRKMLPVEIYAERTLEAVLSKTRSPRLLEFGRELFAKYGETRDDGDQYDEGIEGLNEAEVNIWLGLISRITGAKPICDELDARGNKYGREVGGTYRVYHRDDGHIRIERISRDEE